MKVWVFFLSIFFTVCAQASENKVAGIFSVQSTFKDEGSGAGVKITGTSFYVYLPRTNQYFLVGNVHVLGGEQPRFKNGDKIKILGSLSNVREDLQVFEVPPPHEKPAFTYDSLGFDSANSISSSVKNFCEEQRNKVCIPNVTGKVIPHQRKVMEDIFSSGPYARGVTDAPIVSGMSGSPVLDHSSGKLWLLGVVSAYDRAFPHTYLTEAKSLDKMVEAYSFGKRGQVDSAKMHYRNGLTYLEFADGTLEIVPTEKKAGNGDTADGGDSPRKVGDPYAAYSIEPGYLWKGTTPTIAFLTTKSPHPIYANRAAYEYMESFKLAEDVSLVKPGDDLLRFLFTPLKLNLQAGSVFNEVGHSVGDLQSIKVAADSKGRNESFLIFPNQNEIGISMMLASGDEIKFRLNKHGGLIEGTGSAQVEDSFRPVLTLRSKFSKEFSIDLRRFFFVDISNTITYRTADAFTRHMPSISILDRESGDEASFRYRWVKSLGAEDHPRPSSVNSDLHPSMLDAR